jgi:hypothetical protein
MSTSVEDPDLLSRRLLQRAWNLDGLPEIAAGLLFLAAAGSLYAQEVLPRRSFGQIAAILGFALGLPLMMWVLKPAVKAVRARWLTPRLGYVEYRRVKRRMGWHYALVFTFGPLAWILIVLFGADWLLVPYTGVAGGILLAFIGRRGGAIRFLVFGVLMAISAVVLGFYRLTVPTGFALLYGSQGLLWLITGGVVLTRFLLAPMEGTHES